MREYLFDFKQKILLERGISAEQALVLDYLVKYFDSGNSTYITLDGKKYFWISYDKLLSDLPILNFHIKSLRRLLSDLETKKILQKQVVSNKIYIYINQPLLYFLDGELFKNYLTDNDIKQLDTATAQKCPSNNKKVDKSVYVGGQKCPSNNKKMDKNVQVGGQNCPLIVNYYKNKIKILCDNVRVKDVDKDKFEYLMKKSLKSKLSNIAYDICIKNSKVDLITDKLIIMSAYTTDILKENTHGAFEIATKEVLTDMFEELKSRDK